MPRGPERRSSSATRLPRSSRPLPCQVPSRGLPEGSRLEWSPPVPKALCRPPAHSTQAGMKRPRGRVQEAGPHARSPQPLRSPAIRSALGPSGLTVCGQRRGVCRAQIGCLRGPMTDCNSRLLALDHSPNQLRPSGDTTVGRPSKSVHALAAIHLITTVEFGSSFTSRRNTSGRA